MRKILFFLLFILLFKSSFVAQNIMISNNNEPNEPSIIIDPKNPNVVIAGTNLNIV